MFLKILQNPQENTCIRVSFLVKLQASGNLWTLRKLKNIFFKEHLRTTDSEIYSSYISTYVFFKEIFFRLLTADLLACILINYIKYVDNMDGEYDIVLVLTLCSLCFYLLHGYSNKLASVDIILLYNTIF